MQQNYAAAIYYIKKFGWYLVPIPHGKKGPNQEGWNNPENTIHTIEAAKYWQEHPNDNMGVLLGSSKIVSFDVDDIENTKLCFSSFGLEYDDLLKGAPRIKTREGHDKALFAAPNGTKLGLVTLKWPDKNGVDRNVFELRASDKYQDVLPPSIHPDTKKPYEWMVTPEAGIPPLPTTLLSVWLEWDKFKKQFECACPWAEKKPEPPKKPKSNKPNKEDDIIGWYNEHTPITTALEKCGCKRKGDRYLPQSSTTKIPGIQISGNRFYSHHASFFGDELPHDAFDLFVKFECGGDVAMAVDRVASLKYQNEIRHGGNVAADLLDPIEPVKDEEFVLKVPPSENLITKWQEFGIRTQDSYPEYHIATMMVLISHLIKAEMRPQYGTVGNNMWCIILGSSGVSGKSTACNAAVAITYTEELSPYVERLTNKITPEAFTSALAEHPRRFHHSDECAGFLKFLKRDYASDLAEDIIKAYDGQTVSKTTIGVKGKGGAVIALHPRVSMLWNTVPDAFGENATSDQFASGFFLRPFFIMPQREKPIKRDAPMNQYCADLKQEVILNLANLCRVIGGRTVVFEESEYITEWKHRIRLESAKNGHTDAERSALNRIYEQARKAAMNITLASTGFYDFVVESNKGEGNLVGLAEIHYEIPDKYARIACDWAENVFYKNSLRALKLTYGYGPYGKIMRLLEDGGELSRTEIGDIAHKTGRQLNEFLADLPLVSFQRKVPGTNRPATFYKIQ